MNLTLLVLFAYCIFTCDSSYADSSIQFTPQGNILQIEAATTAVNKGSPLVAITAGNDVLLFMAREKSSVSPLQIRPHQNVYTVQSDENLLLCATGWIPDAGRVYKVAQKIALNHRENFGCSIPVETLASAISLTIHDIIKKGSRPIGAGFFIVGLDSADELQVYLISPDGGCEPYHAAAIGSKSGDIMDHFSGFGAVSSIGDLDKAWTLLSSCVKKHFTDDVFWTFEVLEGKCQVDSATRPMSKKMRWKIFDHEMAKERLF